MNYKYRKISFFIAVFLTATMGIFSDAEAKRRNVDDNLKIELNVLLALSSELHKALYSGNSNKTHSTVIMLSEIVENLQSDLSNGATQLSHLSLITGQIQRTLNIMREVSYSSKVKLSERLFSEVIQIAQNYRLDQYRIFFCPSNKTTWLQASRKAANPFGSDELRACGVAI